jgi:penicillin-binding protein 1A
VKQPYIRAALVSAVGVAILLGGIGYAAVCAYLYLAPGLPDVAALRDVRLQVPLRVYSRDGKLIAQFGEYRRIPVAYEDVPERLVRAVLAAEDDRFFQHHGVDYAGLSRAIGNYLVYGDESRAGGGGTITMQVARNIFFTPERSARRKLSEIFLAFRIESSFSKQEILTLYFNKIFLGQRAYGVAAAAEVYFGKPLSQLTLAETATIAGLPQSPSRDNPVTSAERAKARRAYVLRRMYETGTIDAAEREAAAAEPMISALHGPKTEIEAPYVAEMARADALARYGDAVYTEGYRVITTIDSRLQHAANGSLRVGLIEYDRRHGYRGPVARVELKKGASRAEQAAVLEAHPSITSLQPSVVVDVAERSARVVLRDGSEAQIDWVGLAWARRALENGTVGPEPRSASDVLAPGDIVYVVPTGDTAQLAQPPAVQGALVAVDPRDGAIVALNGGFDFFVSKYNRASQARRQPGSAFKPFIYSAALEKGFTPASIVLDAPVVLEDEAAEDVWRPENSTQRFYGPTRLREALVRSRNLVSVRLMRQLKIPYTVNYLTQFGFVKESLPADLTLALGTLQVTPAELAGAFATFANGGFRVRPYYIQRITLEHANGADETVYQAEPWIVCADCERTAGDTTRIERGMIQRVAATSENRLRGSDTGPWGAGYLGPSRIAPRAISEQNAYLISDMMRDVIRRGTARRAQALNRSDVAGKTGTTNDHHDAWFCGFNANLVASVWVGFDESASLGAGEEGGRTAVPIWTYFMREALRDMPEARLPPPEGLVTVKISPETGLLASADDPTAVFETFMEDRLPPAADPFDRASRREDTGEEEPIF